MIELLITRLDFNSIKFYTELATSENDTFIEIAPHAISDMNGNPVVAIEQPTALPVHNYTSDITPPVLEAFNLDMDGVSL